MKAWWHTDRVMVIKRGSDTVQKWVNVHHVCSGMHRSTSAAENHRCRRLSHTWWRLVSRIYSVCARLQSIYCACSGRPHPCATGQCAAWELFSHHDSVVALPGVHVSSSEWERAEGTRPAVEALNAAVVCALNLQRGQTRWHRKTIVMSPILW